MQKVKVTGYERYLFKLALRLVVDLTLFLVELKVDLKLAGSIPLMGLHSFFFLFFPFPSYSLLFPFPSYSLLFLLSHTHSPHTDPHYFFPLHFFFKLCHGLQVNMIIDWRGSRAISKEQEWCGPSNGTYNIILTLVVQLLYRITHIEKQTYIWGNINMIDAARWVLQVVYQQFENSVRCNSGAMQWNCYTNKCFRLVAVQLYCKSICYPLYVEGLPHSRGI